MDQILHDRSAQIQTKGSEPCTISCEKKSLAGAVSQRACVFCGSRVVLYPIADALHLVHGPIGCAAYTWDIRGALSSGPELHRMSFSTDLREKDIIFGGEPKLYRNLVDLIDQYQPKAAFIYSTCVVGIIGDDVDAICRRVTKEKNIPVIPVGSEGFKGTKKDGYRAACEAILELVGTGDASVVPSPSINILGDFNLAGEIWIIKEYYEQMGVHVNAMITGDGRVDQIRRAHGAQLNVVQCSGSMKYLAKQMTEKYGIPSIQVSYFGLEDMARALYDVARFFNQPEMLQKVGELVRRETAPLIPMLKEYKAKLQGRRAAVYVGGAFKAYSLVKALRLLGISTVLVGSQTGNKDDYAQLHEICDPGTVLLDDTNPMELAKFCRELNVDVFIGGVKERALAYKLGLGFVDHNHERKEPLAGFIGMKNFAQEVYASAISPVWSLIRAGEPASWGGAL